MAQQKLSDPNQALSGRLYHTHGNINKLSCCLVVLLSGCFVVWLFCCLVVLLLIALAGSQYRAKRE